jgi:hypothetical protein
MIEVYSIYIIITIVSELTLPEQIIKHTSIINWKPLNRGTFASKSLTFADLVLD